VGALRSQREFIYFRNLEGTALDWIFAPFPDMCSRI